MTLEDRVVALEPLGFTPRQTRFIALVALHSGYCLRRQYAAFAGIRYGKSVCDLFEKLVARGLATSFTQRADRGRIYHLQARAIYRAIGEPEHRNRREASAALIARRMMVLDYVLSHADVEWFSTEDEKIDLFARLGVTPRDLPQRASAAVRTEASSATRYFGHEAPVAVVGDPPVPTFVCLVTDTTGRMLEQFLRDHGRLFAWLPAWTVVAIGPRPTGLHACEGAFERYLRRPMETVSASTDDDLIWFFRARQAVDQGDLTGLSVTAIDRFRTLREAFRRPVFEELYLAWRRDGDAVLGSSAASARHHGMRSVGTLVTQLLPFDYSQFGSLPGIA
jgi:hypothetical protein